MAQKNNALIPLVIAIFAALLIIVYPIFKAFFVGDEGWAQTGWVLYILIIPAAGVILVFGALLTLLSGSLGHRLDNEPTAENKRRGRLVAFTAVGAIIVAVSMLAFAAFVFPAQQKMMGLAFFVSSVFGGLGGLFVFRRFVCSGSDPKTSESTEPAFSPRDLLPEAVWKTGLALQWYAYLFLLIAMLIDCPVVARQYRDLFWVLFNVYVFALMLISTSAAFWMRPALRGKLTLTFRSVVLFAILYLGFLFLATQIAVPFSITHRISS